LEEGESKVEEANLLAVELLKRARSFPVRGEYSRGGRKSGARNTVMAVAKGKMVSL